MYRLKVSGNNSRVVRCECGFEILLVPDSRALGKAVEDHILEHCNRIQDPAKAEAESDRLWNMLVAQILRKVADGETSSL